MIAKLRSFFTNYINNLSIRTKLLLFFFLLSIIPFFIMTLLNYRTVAKKTEDQTLFSGNQIFEQNVTLLQNKLNIAINVSNSIILDKPIIQKLLKPHSSEYYDNYLQQKIDYDSLSNYIDKFKDYEYIQNLMLYIKPGYFFSDQNISFFNIEKVRDDAWLKEIMDTTSKLIWFPSTYFNAEKSDLGYVSCIRKIRNLDYLGETLGIVKIDISKSEILNLIERSVITPRTYVAIVNSKNEFICSTSGAEDVLVKEFISFDALNTQYKNPKIWYTMKFSNGRYIHKNISIPNTDWKMALFIPYTDLLAASDKSRNYMIIIAVITTFAAYGLAIIFSYSLTKRIKQLIKHMRKIEKGNFDVEILSHSNDEIGSLQKNFNYMITKIAILIDEKYKMGKEIKNADLKALQAQINPHFLYNTLDLIHWKALDKDVPEISTIVQALAKYYKLGLSRGEEIVTLANEMEHVKTYIKIQNIRFQNKIHLDINMDESLSQYKVLKLILQPLAENSILHGIMEKMEMEGRISINAYVEDTSVKITLEDDGVGMSKDKLGTILTSEMGKKSTSYGIRNINDRIKIYYGEEYGLVYKSVLGEGTKVTITLPPQDVFS